MSTRSAPLRPIGTDLPGLPQPNRRQHQRERGKIAAQFPRSPGNRRYALLLADGTQLECPVLSASRSGASRVAPIKPRVGAEVTEENRPAVVVRLHDEGIAIGFTNQKLREKAACGGVSAVPE